MAKNGAGIYAQIFGGLGFVSAVSLQNFVDVSSLEFLLGLSQGNDQVVVFGFQVEVLGGEKTPLSQNHCFLDSVFQLSNVPRPPISLQRGDRAGSETSNGRIEFAGVLLKKVFRQ